MIEVVNDQDESKKIDVPVNIYDGGQYPCKDTPKSSPTTHVTETSFLRVLDPPDLFGTIYIFDNFFTYIHNLDFVFCNKFSLKKLKESRVSSIFTFSLFSKTARKKCALKHLP